MLTLKIISLQSICVTFSRGKGDYQMDYVPAPRITEADKTNDKRYVVKWKTSCIVHRIEKNVKFF